MSNDTIPVVEVTDETIQKPEPKENNVDLTKMEAAIQSWAARTASGIIIERDKKARVVKVPDNIRNYLAERHINPEYHGEPGTMTIENPNRIIAETMINASFTEYGWKSTITRAWQSGGFSASTRSETEILEMNVMLTPLK